MKGTEQKQKIHPQKGFVKEKTSQVPDPATSVDKKQTGIILLYTLPEKELSRIFSGTPVKKI